MPRPSLHTDAYEDSVRRHVPIIFIAGPIKHWWTCWGSPEHERYLQQRSAVRAQLIDDGYLTYAAWDAIKGTWDERAQAINDTAIRTSDLMLDLTPTGIPAHGTGDEVRLAIRENVPVLRVLPEWSISELRRVVRLMVGPGVEYE